MSQHGFQKSLENAGKMILDWVSWFLSFFKWDIDPNMDLYLGITGKRSEPYGEDAECINCYVGTWKSKSILIFMVNLVQNPYTTSQLILATPAISKIP